MKQLKAAQERTEKGSRLDGPFPYFFEAVNEASFPERPRARARGVSVVLRAKIIRRRCYSKL
jgi:hypothetical protein